MMHLLEKGGQILWLGHGDLVPQLEQAPLVEGSPPGGGHVRPEARVECRQDGPEQPKLLCNDVRTFRVPFETGDVLGNG